MHVENAVRSVVWRLSEKWQLVALSFFVLLYIGYSQLRRLRGGNGFVSYGWREAIHAARDRLTPRFLHRHSNEEVAAWFREAGYEKLEIAGDRTRPAFVPISFTANTGVEGVRRAAS